MGQIQNISELAMNDSRRDALAIAEAGYEAINVGASLARKLVIKNGELCIGDKTYRLAGRRVFFVGVGKCAFTASGAIENLFSNYLEGGIALDVSSVGHEHLTKIEMHIGTHPLPSEVNVRATERIIEFLSGRREDDLIIFLISGGGSVLLCSPPANMTYADESALWRELTARGAGIQEINTVRKHLSRARGGGLAAASYPAEVISLIVSDVPGNNIEYIASGPTVRDSSTVDDARAVLARYSIALPENIDFVETPKEERYFERATNVLFLTNNDALSAMRDEAARRGYAAEIADDRYTGEAREVGRGIVHLLHDAAPKTVRLYAGESTVTLDTRTRARGIGGRNQETALAALKDIRVGELILPFASDGHDNTDHAGAIGDDLARAHALAQNLSIEEFLSAHRSYDFFSTTGDALQTGYTGSNVSDLIIALKI
ncbi:hypothetical protein COS69_00255 [Candidatus Kaiserbacteria bacterium CG06_land_8_20_14_3_00_49_31]|nr:MAG: hypothetical protein COS69_00255 [Candidatus Kaiserbacteria bacterium CG06_land_8_20_14_3_00_49_31]